MATCGPEGGDHRALHGNGFDGGYHADRELACGRGRTCALGLNSNSNGGVEVAGLTIAVCKICQFQVQSSIKLHVQFNFVNVDCQRHVLNVLGRCQANS